MSILLACFGCGAKSVPDKEETKVLDYQHHSLTSVPSDVFESERFLEELYLDFNQICELPRELFHCHELSILSLSDNDLQTLPVAISSLTNLISLDLSKNGISIVPDTIKSCKKLAIVNVSTNPLCRLPEGITQLVSLRELCLSDTFLEYLPANFGRLSGLEVLELRENQLNTLPRSMTRLTSLKRLDLGQNEFTELPEVIGHLTALSDLWFDNNRIKRIPDEIKNLAQLTFIDGSKNRIQELSSSIGNCKLLKDLYLSQNDLESLPDELSQCTSLESLQLDENNLEILPINFGDLDQLNHVDLSHNEIICLPPSFGMLRNLVTLHIDDNVLSELPREMGSCSRLVVFTAAHNKILKIPPELGNLSRVKVINLCGNLIKSLPVSFTKLTLKALWLSENQAKPSVPLQCIIDIDSGQKVLTCFMLPQDALTEKNSYGLANPILSEEPKRSRGAIHFAPDGQKEPAGRLHRIPTPYPKELRALERHTRNMKAMKKVNKSEMVNPSDMKSKPDIVTASIEIDEKQTVKLLNRDGLANTNIKRERIELKNYEQNLSTKEEVGDTKLQSKLRDKKQKSETSTDDSIIENSSQIEGRRAMRREYSSPTKEEHQNGSGQIDNVDHQMHKPLPITVRPASIAVPTASHQLPHHNLLDGPASNHSRPNSLALDQSLPPWQVRRPGSLAAPINIVGLPKMPQNTRAVSHTHLYQPPQSIMSNFRDGKLQSNAPNTYQSLSSFQSIQRSPLARIQHEEEEEYVTLDRPVEVSPGSPFWEKNEDVMRSEANGLVSIINQLTDAEMKEDMNGAKEYEDDKVNLNVTYSVAKQESPAERGDVMSYANKQITNSVDISPQITKSPLQIPKNISRIPKNSHVSPHPLQSPTSLSHVTSNASHIPAYSPQTPPNSYIPTNGSHSHPYPPPTSQNSTHSPTHSQIPANSQIPTNTYLVSQNSSQIPTNNFRGSQKGKSQIPTLGMLANANSPENTGNEIRSPISPNCVTLKPADSTTPNISRIPKIGSLEITPPDIKGTTRIPTMYGRSNSNMSQESMPTKRPSTTSASSLPHPYSPNAQSTPLRQNSNIPISPISGIPAPKSIAAIARPTSPQSSIPTFETSPQKESRIPSLASPHSHSPSLNANQSQTNSRIPLSPIERPINTTGIPIISPSSENSEKSRIPKSRESSLRGRKSSLPTRQIGPGEHGVKHPNVQKAWSMQAN